MADNKNNNERNVPPLRFPEFSGEWETKSINDLADVIGGGTPDTTVKSYWDGEIQWFTPSEIGKNKFVDASLRTITEDGLNNSSAKLLPPNTILLSSRATIGECSLSLRECATNQGFQSLVSKKCNVDFLYYLIQTKKKDLIRKSCGSTFLEISANEVRKIQVSVPSDVEQQKIAGLLSLIDKRIATQNKIIEDLKKLKSAIIEKTFNENYSNKIRLRDVGSYIRGLTYSSDDVVESNGIFVMRSNNIINGSSLDYHNNIVSVNKQILTEQQLQTGDIVICMANGSSSLVGKSSFYDGDCSTPITVGAFCGIYRSKEPIVKWLFQTNKYRRYIWNSLQGGNGAIANLNGDDILRMSFSIPATPAKDNRIKLLTSVDTLLESNISLCDLYISQKLYLLRQMFI
ncbi:restriction endonuclease subunit S [Bacteroides fragilis]|uniref:restriction endonuclease subunit S n=2 Tax=Bacteroides fragilis TaxID=817 RepID=UPI0004AEFD20|nr:restriction endonuclease subunit S [Bacteroides fragilis]